MSVLVLASLLVTCKKKPNIEGFSLDIEKVEVGTTTVSISGTYVYPGTIYSITALLSEDREFTQPNNIGVDLDGNSFKVLATGLEHSTLYYYRFRVDYGGDTDYFTEIDTFTTKDYSMPKVHTAEVSYVGPHSATCGGEVVDDGGFEVTARGVCYGTMQEPTLNNFFTVDGEGIGAFVSELTDLLIGTRYYVRAYATNEKGTVYGEVVQFTTMAQSPTVKTLETFNVTETSARVKSLVIADGGNAVTERGVCWSTSEEPTLDDATVLSGTGLGEYTCEIAGLESGKTYYVRAFARNDVGLGFGEVLSFTTGIPIVKPTVSTVEVVDVAVFSARCLGNVSDNGGAEITDRGVCWSKNPNPSISGNHASGGTGMGSFSVQLTNLTASTRYYVRAYATNSQGTSYGEELEFETQDGLPMVTTASVINITATAALGGGEVVSQGASSVTERGICWGLSPNPTISGTHASSGTGIGPFEVAMSNLTPNQTYYVRAYATNAQGTSYGSEVSFVPMDGLPEVTTSAITNIMANSARGGGNVVSEGASSVTVRGVCWSTEHNPTVNNDHANSGSGAGSYTCDLLGLTAGTTYYVRAFAINEKGVAYGEELSFTTSANPPEVTTSAVTNITQTTAFGGGNVISSGGSPVTERGICWSTSHNPTMNDSHVANGFGMGSFTAQMTGLQVGTTYYVRAYATNAQGTAYGNEVSFTTTANAPMVTTSQVSNISQTTALGGGNVTSDGGSPVTERGICWSTSHNPTMSGPHASGGTGMGAFSVEMTGLAQNTTYYVRAYAVNSSGTAYGSEVSFTTTQSTSAPTVITQQASNITQTTATAGGLVSSTGGAEVTERGVCWSTSHAPTVNGSHASSGSGLGSYSVQMTGLAANTTYYIRAYAINSAGTSYGNELSFTTLPNAPTVTTSPVSNIAQTTALGGGNVTSSGGATVTQRGICWSTQSTPTLTDSHIASGSGTGSFTAQMTGLTANTTYYVRAYAINSAGTSYGNVVSFTTAQNVSAPTVTTNAVTNITQISALGGGNVTNDGGGNVTERGICWSTEHNPTTDDAHGNNGTGMGSFTVNMADLTPGTTYYVRAYAINSAGTSYGNEVSFSTTEYLYPPTVTTAQVSNITQTSAIGGGNVVSDGGDTVTERGICWSTSHNPTVSGNHASGGTGTGSYTVNMTGLTANTTYYVRAYAVNNIGTSYGEEVSFTTPQHIAAPTVTTSNVTNIAQTTATGGGNVTYDGGATVTERGICWSTNPNPTMSDSHATGGTGLGSFSVQMTGLSANTMYYVRAYAVNSAGTSYGNEVTFTTLASAPTVTTQAVTNIMPTSATGGGNVTSDGGASITERGICWSTNHNPTVTNSHASSGTGTGSYTVSMTGLTPNTTYYVRAYATNGSGTSYGNEVSFTTSQDITLPSVSTIAVTNIAQTTATGGGNVTNDGGGNVTERGICWSTTHNPTVSNSHVASGTGTGSFTANMTGLTPNTTYYVRAYAINSAGTAYGAEVSFTTTQAITVPTVTTSNVTNITQTTATGGGNVTNDGGAAVTERGICWSTSHNPTMSNSHVASGTGTGSFTIDMTGLAANTTYYVRAYAVNSVGVSYGAEVSFTTLQNATAPTVTTSTVTGITQTSAIGGGNVTNDGGAAVTERGICWSTSHNPTISGNHQSNGTGTGSFTVNMSGLAPGTTYYVRAYAVNSVGVSYGDEVNFTTQLNPTVPMVTTSTVTGITQTSATGGGNVTSDGGATVTERGICWSTSHTPTVSDNYATSGTGTGSFTVGMNDLTPSTTYYVRAYAINSIGINYGSEVSFTTQSSSQAPTGAINGIFSVSASEQVYFSQGNMQYQATTNTWRFAPNQYDYIGFNNSNMSATYSGWIDLLGWGTSGYQHGAVCWQPWSTAIVESNYKAYGNSTADLCDQTGQADWGYNAISNGGNQTNFWRTLSKAEWTYVFNTRNTPSGIRYAKAQVCGVSGVLLLPDNWNSATYSLNGANAFNTHYDSNVISEADWSNLENAGVVFLPAAGARYDRTVSGYGSKGYYWSTTHNDIDCAHYVDISNGSLSPTRINDRYMGQSVRVVCPAQ